MSKHLIGSGILDWIRDVPAGISRLISKNKDISTISPFVKEMIVLADSTYHPPRDKIDQWFLIFHTDRIRIYKKGSMIVIGVTGTDDKLDVYDDTLLARGKLETSPRYKELKNVVEMTKSKYPSDRIIAVGHSLGGGMVLQLAKDFKNLEGYIFNPGVNLRHLRDKSFDLRNIHTFVMEHDPLALTSSFLPNTTKYNYPWSLKGNHTDHLTAHSLKTFLGIR